ncbi:hypothetical protein E4K10_25710 [Streptomyces sp. T1317-0309]|nr:hypothetical protein E4K10_25710 [Streptomyces sp. T1317-0309]
MGEQLGGDGFPGRRRVHPDGTVAGPGERRTRPVSRRRWPRPCAAVMPTPGRSSVLSPRSGRPGTRASTGPGPVAGDWRVREERRVGRPLRTTFAVILASLTLGGVAVAAIGSAGSSSHGAGPGTGDKPSTGASALPGKEPSAVSPTRPGRADRQDTAKDTAAHCRAYAQVKGRGKALDSTAWQRLVTAAGGGRRRSPPTAPADWRGRRRPTARAAAASPAPARARGTRVR